MLALLLLSALPAAMAGLAAPYHRQVTPWACGDAATEMALHAFGRDVDQRALMAVMRTTNYTGTLSYDIVRGMHFSALSAAPSDFVNVFPEQRPTRGWAAGQGPPGGLGLAAFGFRGDDFASAQCPSEQLCAALAAGFSVVTLEDYRHEGGHYRTSVRCDAARGTVVQHDPWDREEQPRVMESNHTGLCARWNYSETDAAGESLPPFFSAAGRPFAVELAARAREGSGYELRAAVAYPYPLPEVLPRHAALVAAGAVAELALPAWMNTSEPLRVPLGDLAPGQSAELSWRVDVQGDHASVPVPVPESAAAAGGSCADGGDELRLVVSGVVSASVPESFGGLANTTAPAYDYSDRIGGVGVLRMAPNFLYDA